MRNGKVRLAIFRQLHNVDRCRETAKGFCSEEGLANGEDMRKLQVAMRDGFGRTIHYLRLSITDRCNFRCVYCMGDDVQFVPRSEVLALEEIVRLCRCFIRLGTDKIRITGGEPLVREGVVDLVRQLGDELAPGRLSELTMTTNGRRLADVAEALYGAGMRRINVSLDTLDAGLFRQITRRGELEPTLDGIAAARNAGLRVKLNAVVLKGVNEAGLDDLIAWAGRCGHDLTLIEAMPLGGLAGRHSDRFVPMSEVERRLGSRWTLIPNELSTAGPARYCTVAETGGTLGFISSLSHCFCGTCNRVRLTSTGTLALCLGQDAEVDLRRLLRSTNDDQVIERAILAAIKNKPHGHRFAAETALARAPAGRTARMSWTGG